MKKLLALLLVVGVAAARYFVPNEPDGLLTEDVLEEAEAGEAVGTLQLSATRLAAVGAGRPERWVLQSGAPEDGTRLTLDLPMAPDDPKATSPMTAVLTGTAGADAAQFLRDLAIELRSDRAAPRGAPVPRLELRVVVLGTHLSPDTGQVGARVVAGRFSNSPAGDWHVLRVALAPARGEFFLALNAVAGAARILMLDPGEGTFIVGELARLLGVAAPAAADGAP